MMWNTPDFRSEVQLPSPWGQLANPERFPPMFYERVRRFALIEHDRGRLKNFEEFLEILGESYLKPFCPEAFPSREAGAVVVQEGFLSALKELAKDFEGLVPSVLWDTLASLATRDAPLQDRSIIEVEKSLKHPWYICDAALHALGASYGLFLHVQSRLASSSGHVLMHGCGCSHFMEKSEMAAIRYSLPRERFPKAGKEFLDHLLGQAVLIVADGYPFVLNDEELRSRETLALRPVA